MLFPGGQISQGHRNSVIPAKASTSQVPELEAGTTRARQPRLPHLPISLMGRGPGEVACTDLVLFMDRTESTEEELNDGQVIITCGNVQTGVACLWTEIRL